MAQTKAEMQRQLDNFKKELKTYEQKLKNETDPKKKANLAMAVAGYKNSIKEIGTQLRNM